MYDPSKPYKAKIQQLISDTWDTPYLKITTGLYPVLDKKISSLEIDHTDGIGTKGFYHWRQKTFTAAVIDALAMNLNDLAMMQAIPYKIQNHLTLPEDDHSAILAIIKALATECRKRQIAMTGGETSIHDNSELMDISISMSGIIKQPKTNIFSPGDILVGLASNGLHSNGFSIVRKIFKNEYRPEFTKPTTIYIDKILKLASQVEISGMMHITGGAFTKLLDILDSSDAIITSPLKPQPIFREIYKRRIIDREMYETFNCGTGFVIAVKPEDAVETMKMTGGSVIGKLVKGRGKIRLTSAFSGEVVEY